MGSPPSLTATNARYLPSGEYATKLAAGVNVTTPGGASVNLTGVRCAERVPPLRISGGRDHEQRHRGYAGATTAGAPVEQSDPATGEC